MLLIIINIFGVPLIFSGLLKLMTLQF